MSGLILGLSVRFVIVYMIVAIGLVFVKPYTGLSIAWSGMLPLWLAALDGGMRFAHRTGRPASGAEAWGLSFLYMWVSMLLSAALLTLLFLRRPDAWEAISQKVPAAYLAIFLLVIMVISFVGARPFVGWGGRIAGKPMTTA